MWQLFRSNPSPAAAAAAETVVDPLQPAVVISPVNSVGVDKGLKATMKSSPSHCISEILVFILSLNIAISMAVLKDNRAKMTNQSAFEINGNGLFLIISICFLFASEISSVILFTTNLQKKCYAFVKGVALFSSYITLWSLMLFFDDAPKKSWILYLISLAFSGMALTYIFLGDEDSDRVLDKKSLIAVLAYIGSVMLPISYVAVFCVPQTYNWLVYSIIHPTAVMEMVSVVMILLFKVVDFQRISQDNDTSDNDLIAHKDQKKDDLEAGKIQSKVTADC